MLVTVIVTVIMVVIVIVITWPVMIAARGSGLRGFTFGSAQ
jgi:hypothetical protein